MSEAIIEPRLIIAEPEAAKETASDIEWITCRGCKGEIGVPFAMRERLIECPGCGMPHKLSETILFRPATPAAAAPEMTALEAVAWARAQIPVVGNQPAKASVALLRSADTAFNWGIASIVLGWSIIVPFIGFFQYIDVSNAAKKENTVVPGKATIGLALSLLFGVAQGVAIIASGKLR